MKNNIVLKVANPGDAPAIAEIEKECFSDPWSVNSVKEFISHAENTILCAMCESELCAYISETHILDEVQIANVAVSAKFRQRGIASLLMEALINKCVSHNVTMITLEVRQSNIPATNLYEKFGFESEGIRRNYYRNPQENAVIMNRYFNEGNET